MEDKVREVGEEDGVKLAPEFGGSGPTGVNDGFDEGNVVIDGDEFFV